MSWFTMFLRGAIRVQLHGASPEDLLNRIVRARIPFWGLHRSDEFTIELSIFRADRLPLAQVVSRGMGQMELRAESGFHAAFGGLRHRPVLLFGLLAAVAAVLLLQHTVWYFDLSGSGSVSQLAVLQALEEVGIRAGTCTIGLHAERLENELLTYLPSLEQITINFYGGRAEVLMRERAEKPELIDRRDPCNLISAATGVIEEMEILSGQPAVQIGQTVLPGQILVSGLVDRRAGATEVRAIGEVYAKTWRKKTAAMPSQQMRRVHSGQVVRQRTLLLGKKRIKLFFGSGISGTECDKMSVTQMLTLPGGHILPFGIETATLRPYTLQPDPAQADTQAEILQAAAIRAALLHTQAAEILSVDTSYAEGNGAIAVTVDLTCREMIARESKYYKSGVDANDGTDDKRGSR